jgi:hypothetical protein
MTDAVGNNNGQSGPALHPAIFSETFKKNKTNRLGSLPLYFLTYCFTCSYVASAFSILLLALLVFRC